MQTKNLIQEIAKDTGLKKGDIKIIMNSLKKIVNKEVRRGIDVEINGIVSLKTEMTTRTLFKHPKTKEDVIKPIKFKLKAKPNWSLAKAVSEKPCYAG